LDLPAKFDEIAAATRVRVADDFGKYGLELVDFFINAISPPEEVQKAIDARSSMGAIGNLHAYTMYQAANSMSKMAEQGGGPGGNAMGMGMGAGFGMMLPGMINQAMQQGQPAPQPAGQPAPQQRGPAQAPTAGVATGFGAGLSFDELAAARVDARQLVRQVAQAAGWSVEEQGETWSVTVPLGALRKQTVHVRFDAQDEEGDSIIAFSSTCGTFNERNSAALLRYNTKMVHGAFAVQNTPAGEMIVVQANQLTDAADPLAVTRVMTAVAWQADKVEERLGGSDTF
jgi:hypothetical protein